MIIRGGENISPGEVENLIESHPKVDEAAVISKPEIEWGQGVVVVVVLKRGDNCTDDGIIGTVMRLDAVLGPGVSASRSSLKTHLKKSRPTAAI